MISRGSLDERDQSLQSEPRDRSIGISSHVFFYPIEISKGIRKHFANSNSDITWFIYERDQSLQVEPRDHSIGINSHVFFSHRNLQGNMEVSKNKETLSLFQ